MTPWDAIVGPAHVRAGRQSDAVDGVVPAAVVRPGSIEEVAAVVRAATGRALVASGLGGHLDMGAPPARLDALVRLDRLARVVAHEAGDMTVAVEAGCSLGTLAARLATAGQWLPLDPPRPEVTTVGGLVAANLWGPLRTSQGGVRDHLIGLRVVGADGAVTMGGGRVVKNVAGYDLPKLHVGGLGTLGVIVEAVFKVRPRPRVEAALVVSCPGVRAAVDLALEVRDRIEPLWLAVDRATLTVGLGGIEEEIAEAKAHLPAGRCEDEAAGLRRRIGAFAGEPAAAVLRVATLPGRLGELVEVAGCRAVAHPALGVIHVAVAEAARAGSVLEELRRRAVRSGGTVVVERATAEVKATLDVWGDAGPGLPLMRRLKTAFDPEARLAPGRFVGGI